MIYSHLLSNLAPRNWIATLVVGVVAVVSMLVLVVASEGSFLFWSALGALILMGAVQMANALDVIIRTLRERQEHDFRVDSGTNSEAPNRGD